MKNKSENKAYKFRIYPTEKQEEFLCKEAGLLRLLWNLTLAKKNEDFSYLIPSYKQVFLQLKPEALDWCSEIDSDIFNSGFQTLKNAFDNFFNSCKKKRKGKFVKPPKFKKKTKELSIKYTVTKPKFKNGDLILTKKLGPLKGVFHRFAEGILKSSTIERTASGKWFISIVVEKKKEKKNKNGKFIGIDWNCGDEDFLSLSNGTKVKCPRFLKRKMKKLKHLQKLQSKKLQWEIKGKKKKEVQSNSYEKISLKVTKLNEKIANQRKDWLHKISRKLCNEYQYIVVEDINLQSMAEMNHGKVIGDQGFGMFRQFINYKGTLIKVPANYTSQDCNVCGYRYSGLTLSQRAWVCPVCGTSHDRDINAAKNILYRGIKLVSGSLPTTTEGTSGCNASGELYNNSMKEENSKSSSKQKSIKISVDANGYISLVNSEDSIL